MPLPRTPVRLTATLLAGALLPLVAPTTLPAAQARPVKTSYGAQYDPQKCHVTSASWKGHRRFYLNTTRDAGCFTSPWWYGAHPVMLSYGPTKAPWYPSHVHHGLDIDMPVGTAVRTAVAGRVWVRPSTLGPAYGTRRMLIRSGGRDYVLGHLSSLSVRNGQWVRAGQVVGRSGMNGTQDEDGPHLHLEVRPAGRSYASAVDPWRAARMRRL